MSRRTLCSLLPYNERRKIFLKDADSESWSIEPSSCLLMSRLWIAIWYEQIRKALPESSPLFRKTWWTVPLGYMQHLLMRILEVCLPMSCTVPVSFSESKFWSLVASSIFNLLSEVGKDVGASYLQYPNECCQKKTLRTLEDLFSVWRCLVFFFLVKRRRQILVKPSISFLGIQDLVGFSVFARIAEVTWVVS